MISALPLVIYRGFKTNRASRLIRIGYERCCVDDDPNNSRNAESAGIFLKGKLTRRTTQNTRATDCAGILQKGRQVR